MISSIKPNKELVETIYNFDNLNSHIITLSSGKRIGFSIDHEIKYYQVGDKSVVTGGEWLIELFEEREITREWFSLGGFHEVLFSKVGYFAIEEAAVLSVKNGVLEEVTYPDIITNYKIENDSLILELFDGDIHRLSLTNKT